MKKDVTICFRTNEELKHTLEKIAEVERRSLSSIIENILHGQVKDKVELKGAKKERRRYQRKEVSLPAFVYKHEAKESTLQTGIVINVSLGGLRISIPKEYDVVNDAEFDTIFSIPNEKTPVKMRCAIRRIVEGGDSTKELGADFIDGDFPSYQKLHRYLG
ncbi:MAG: PilZ domain-containing protein [Syntrophorhabdaceae bacterium]|nr:PilZ domain-containing protein [Syntrophorhabdaceae bacterium]MDD4195034.1 PilZ domain-containing protein [Syntrophorhabdaceae bacterium]HOC46529.1 PilZ domain-containing protein [Syntrophorhabdaceae bacterium]